MDIKEIRNIIRGVLNEYRSAMGTTDGQLMQGELDWDHFITPGGMFGPDTQAATEEFNDNINRELNLKANFDDDSWSQKPSANRNMFTEDEMNELFPNAATLGGEALPHQPKKAVNDDEEAGTKDQLMIQRKTTGE